MRILCFIISILSALTVTHATNRALLVGIGQYDKTKTGWARINGDDDIHLIKEELLKNNFSGSDIRTLINSNATKKAIMEELGLLASRCRSGDVVFFHFSGHGQLVSDLNGDETDRFDESIVPYDACKTTRYKIGNAYYNGDNHLIDDELNHLLDNIKKKIGPDGYLMVTVDACYSRGIEMDGAANGYLQSERERKGRVRGTSDKFRIDPNIRHKTTPFPKDFSGGGRMVVITACREDERNFQYKVPGSRSEYGSLSYTVYLLLKRGRRFAEWEKYFKEGEYIRDGIFCSEQHPKINIYK